MDKTRLIPKQKAWFVIGLGIVLLVGAVLFLNGEVWQPLFVIPEKASKSDAQPEQGTKSMDKMPPMEGMLMSERRDMGPAQASAMVTPMRQQGPENRR